MAQTVKLQGVPSRNRTCLALKNAYSFTLSQQPRLAHVTF
jgi:hypothetical protein